MLGAGIYFVGRLCGLNVTLGPQLTAPRLIELGDLPPQTERNVTIQLRNEGVRPLLISNASSECRDCVSVIDFPRQHLNRGASGTLTLRVSADTRQEETSERRVFIQSNDWRTGPFVIIVRWRVVPLAPIPEPSLE